MKVPRFFSKLFLWLIGLSLALIMPPEAVDATLSFLPLAVRPFALPLLAVAFAAFLFFSKTPTRQRGLALFAETSRFDSIWPSTNPRRWQVQQAAAVAAVTNGTASTASLPLLFDKFEPMNYVKCRIKTAVSGFTISSANSVLDVRTDSTPALYISFDGTPAADTYELVIQVYDELQTEDVTVSITVNAA